MRFSQPVIPSHMLLTFQGGFSARTVTTYLYDGDALVGEHAFHPEDTNACQRLELRGEKVCNHLRIVFEEACDLFGRIVLYRLEVLGTDVPQ